MILTPKEKKTLVVQEVRNGKGIVTKKRFVPEEVIYEVRGVRITGDVDEDISDEVRANAYRYDADTYISPEGRLADMLNHSCEPNAKMVKKGKKLLIVAIVPIAKGEEVVMDYSTMLADDDIWSMKCDCGSSLCRKKVKRFSTLPKALKMSYIERGMVPSYVWQEQK